jgi:NAD+ synthase
MKYKFIIDWLKEYSERSYNRNFVVGISGGIDSAVTSTLCAETGITTYVVSLPIQQSNTEVQLAEDHIEWLVNKYPNVVPLKYELDNVYTQFTSLFETQDDLANANSRSRLRMTTLYHIAAKTHSLVVGTGNKVEDFGIGFFTKYGDGGVDISPIADLMKSEVKEAGCELGIILPILEAKPTDGLWEDGRTDEDQIGATYDELEWAMTFGGDKRTLKKREKEVLAIYYNLQYSNKHKMEPIPVCKSVKDV